MMEPELGVRKLARELVDWIRESVSAARGRGVVVGMSGGIDSSVAAALCARAFPSNTLGVIIPCHSSALDREHAELVAARLGIPAEVVVLDGVYDALLDALPAFERNQGAPDMASANLKPRLRMAVLYYFANRFNYLVVGASNRSELSVGYFTKHGDGGVDLMPLANLVKRQVYELADHLGIPDEVMDKPPSAGLWPGQTDEAELGLTYNQLDHYLLTGEADVAVKGKIDSMIQRSGHKLRPPVVPPA